MLQYETNKIRKKIRKVVLWASHPNIIAFSKLNNGKYDNQLLIWKVLSFLFTLCQFHLLCPNCPSVFSSSASSVASQPPYHPLSFGSFLSSFFTHENPKSLISVQKPKSKTLRRCQNVPFGLSRSHRSPRESEKNKWSLGGESGYPKTETLTSKCVLDSQIRVQDSFINKK